MDRKRAAILHFLKLDYQSKSVREISPLVALKSLCFSRSKVGAVWVLLKVSRNDSLQRLKLATLHLESFLDNPVTKTSLKINLKHQCCSCFVVRHLLK